MTQPLDSIAAVLEMAGAGNEILAIAGDGTSGHVDRLWQQALTCHAPNISGMPASTCRAGSSAAGIESALAISHAGRRTALLCSSLPLLPGDLSPPAPLVIHLLQDRLQLLPGRDCFQLLSRTPQQAYDLSAICHRTAELSLYPGVHVCCQPLSDRERVMIETVDMTTLRRYIGLADDEIETPTAAQRGVFGDKRRRIPCSAPGIPGYSDLEGTDAAPQMCRQAMQEFSQLTGRAYTLVEEIDTASADVILIAPGSACSWLVSNIEQLRAAAGCAVGILNPTLLTPFPGELITAIVQRKKGVVLLTGNLSPDDDPVLRELRVSFDKAIANGLSGNIGVVPHPQYPSYTTTADHPPLLTISCGSPAVCLDALAAAVTRLVRGRSGPCHIRLAPTSPPNLNEQQSIDASNLTLSAPETAVTPALRQSAVPDEQKSTIDDEAALHALRAFYRFGRASDDVTPLSDCEPLTPALFYAGNHGPGRNDVDGNLLPGSDATASEILDDCWKSMWQEQKTQLCIELEAMQARLMSILASDFDRSAAATTPEYLEAAIGTDGVDAAALSHILTQRDYAATMPESRQIRIAEVLDTFNRTHSRLEQNEFAAVCRAHNTDAATGRFAVLARTLVEYFRAVRIAQLEIDSHYREDRHDAWFARFSWDYVSPEERALCPPLLVSVGAEAIDETLLSLLATKLPVKILARIADVHHASGMVTQLAAGMLATGSAYVLQAGTADTRLLKTGISDGLRYSGPALFCIDEGGAGESSAAVRSRAFPAFICNPAAGRTWAERLSIAATPDHQQDWALENVTYTAADGSVTTMEMPFTLADCLAADTRFAAHFAVATKYRHNAAMMPVGDFIELDPGDTADRIPYILMASRSGVLEHVIVTTAVITEMRKCVSRWRYLQELGGVNNSHVLSRMGAVEAQLEARHQEDLQVAREATRQSVVERITAGLLGLGPTDVMPTVAPLPLPDTTETPQVDGTAAGDIGASPPPANDAAVIEPYIDSLLCTTCNECTNINNRLFAYDESKQAYIRDPAAGTYRHLVLAAEKCPIKIIHPGKPRNPDEKGVAALVKRAAPYNSV